eukprot:GHUV01028637.1.p2 GENE.GHUV01028637.1~~GHUV01028637.1.p2  ORF type:complete len:139 (+),score=29.56 GHUV01028637.1:907-1323(+)
MSCQMGVTSCAWQEVCCSKHLPTEQMASAADVFTNTAGLSHGACLKQQRACLCSQAVAYRCGCPCLKPLAESCSPVKAAAYNESPIAKGAVLPWPGFATAAAYTVMTSRKVMNTSHQNSSPFVTSFPGAKQPGAISFV